MGTSGDGGYQLANYLQQFLEQRTPAQLRRAWPAPTVLLEVVGNGLRVHGGTWAAAGKCSGKTYRTLVTRCAPLSPLYSFQRLDTAYRLELARLVHALFALLVDVHAYHVKSSLRPADSSRIREQELPTPFLFG